MPMSIAVADFVEKENQRTNYRKIMVFKIHILKNERGRYALKCKTCLFVVLLKRK